mgnify:CR=1 FL=1
MASFNNDYVPIKYNRNIPKSNINTDVINQIPQFKQNENINTIKNAPSHIINNPQELKTYDNDKYFSFDNLLCQYYHPS